VPDDAWVNVDVSSPRVPIVRMHRGRGNAFSTALALEVANGVRTAMTSQARAVVLTSAAENFCVGADLQERRRLDDSGLMTTRAATVALTELLLSSEVPVVVGVHGYALGVGTELALACDLVAASADAVFGLPEGKVGIVPGGGGTQLLARRVGWGRAREMMLTGRSVPAAEAHRAGLVDRLSGQRSAEAAAVELGSEIAELNPNSVRLIREAMTGGYGAPLQQGLRLEDDAWRYAALSPDYREGLAACADRRPPSWS
jgi:enoyl-CoA hydratase/carnithine racemase